MNGEQLLDEPRDPDAILAAVVADEARKARGRLKIFLGAMAGVGKTYEMLSEAHIRREQEVDVVIGVVETHGREETASLMKDTEVLPRRRVEHRGTELTEFDLDAALARHPDLLLVDELAHTNAPGSRHAKRWQDVEEILAAGIDVYTTVNIQHIESLNDQVARLTGVQVWETIPDRVVADANEVELIDVAPDELLFRLRAGKVYIPEQVRDAEINFFKPANVIALRELALRETAARVDSELQALQRRHGRTIPARLAERVLACVGADAYAPLVIREAARLASALGASWVALYVETPALARRAPQDRERVLAALKLAESLGAATATLGSVDIARTVLNFARSRGITRVVVGKPTRRPWLRRLAGSLIDTLISEAADIDVQLVAHVAGADILANRGIASSVAGLGRSERPPLRWRRYLWAAGLVVAALGVGWLLHPDVPASGVVMLFLLAVVLAGTRLGRGPATITALGGAITFNYFFTEPRFTLAIQHVSDVLTFVALLIVGLVVAHLSAQVRHQARVAVQREERAVSLGAFTESLLAAHTEQEIAETGCSQIARAFVAEVDLLIPAPGRALRSALDRPSVTPGFDASVARWVLEHNSPAGAGTDTLPSAPLHYLPLAAGDQALAVLALRPLAPRRLFLPEPRRALDAYAHQLALALERARLLRQTREAELAVQAEDLRNALLAGLSHDLRTPLASILGSSSALLDDRPALATPQARELVATIHDETLRMTRLATNLLEMARLTQGMGKLRRDWIPLDEMIGSVRNRLSALLRGRTIRVSLESNLPLLHVDGLLFEQVLQNLIENAARYSPEGTSIDIAARIIDSGETPEVRIVVMDRGPGIDDGLKASVFEKFYRIDPEAAQSGTGLGLAISKAIVALHGGRIGVEDRPGGGATFWVTLPLPDDAPAASTEDDIP